MNETHSAIRARYVFPVSGPPIENGVVCWQGDRLRSVGSEPPAGPVQDLGHVAVLPGLVNAHTHLEFSELTEPLGQPNTPFADWIAAVVAWRRGQSEAAQGEAAQGESAEAEAGQGESGQAETGLAETGLAETGLAESLAAGVTLLGEIATCDWTSAGLPAGHGPMVLAFRELLGLAEERVEPLLELARTHLDAGERAVGWRAGISPHAPYTVSHALLEAVVRLSRQRACTVAMHLAETLEEIELLASHSGPLVERLRQLDAWHPQAIPRGIQPADYLRLLSESHRALVVHGNFLQAGDWRLLADRRERMSVVYCPRTHAYFGHGRYPLAEMLAAGVRVCLGTDSRASNPDLDLLAEAFFVAHRHPEVGPAEVLRMATLAGAEALGMADQRGSLEVGKRSDLVVVELPESGAGGTPYELLWRQLPRRRRVYLGGACVWDSLEPRS